MSAKIVTFGCRLNTYESAAMREFSKLSDDFIIVNTCAVTSEAERQCRQEIRRLKRENPDAFIIATGCAAQLFPEKFAAMEEVDKVLGNKEKLNPDLFVKSAQKVVVSPVSRADPDIPLPDLFEGRNRAFMQIQQGCDHACTFCIVPHARGKSVVLPKDEVLKRAQKLTDAGYAEICLTGVDISSYPDFAGLLRQILDNTRGLKRLRLGSVDPALVNDDFISLFGQSDILMPHLHLSVQAGGDMILRRMARRHLRGDVIKLCEKLRAARPDIVFGADFITGFPTETQAQFNDTLDLVEQCGMTHLHVFPYSERSGTPAAKMPQIPVPVRRDRAKILREKGDEMMLAYMKSRLGSTAVVLCETDEKGLCEQYINVKIVKKCHTGDFVKVRLTGIAKPALFEGSVCES